MKRSHSALDEIKGTDGSFQRQDAQFRNVIKKGGEFEPEADRYHLYIAYACPWANRCAAMRALKGLDKVIGMSIVHPTWQRTSEKDDHCGWVFKSPDDPNVTASTGLGNFSCEGCVPDTINNAKTVRELYEMSNDSGHKYSVPVLWDKKTKQIVNNESADIILMFNSAFNSLLDKKHASLDFHPKDLEDKIKDADSWIYPTINNGVYRCGFAKKQGAYDTAIGELSESLDRLEAILEKNRYVTGDRLTTSDIRLFMTLVRFDEVYVVYFKCNVRTIASYPNIHNYVRELYQMPEIQSTINMDHIKMHYYTSHPVLNAYSVIPRGPNAVQGFLQPHDCADRKYSH